MKSKQTTNTRTTPTAGAPDDRRTPRRALRWAIGGGVLAVLAALVVVSTLSAPGGGTPVLEQDSASQRTAGAGGDDGQSSGKRLRRFTLADVTGRKLTRPTGRKPGVLVFTASYCTPCIAQAPGLVAEMRKFGSRAEILTLSIDPGDSSAALRDAFKPAIGDARAYPLAWDPSGQLAPAFNVTALGTEVVYDRAGREVWRGVLSAPSEIAAALRRAGAS